MQGNVETIYHRLSDDQLKGATGDFAFQFVAAFIAAAVRKGAIDGYDAEMLDAKMGELLNAALTECKARRVFPFHDETKGAA